MEDNVPNGLLCYLSVVQELCNVNYVMLCILQSGTRESLGMKVQLALIQFSTVVRDLICCHHASFNFASYCGLAGRIYVPVPFHSSLSTVYSCMQSDFPGILPA